MVFYSVWLSETYSVYYAVCDLRQHAMYIVLHSFTHCNVIVVQLIDFLPLS